FAREQLTVAFRLRQRLDDEVPRDDADRRRVLQEIVRRCAEAGRRLDARSDAFDRLRDLESNAPAVLAEVAARHRRVAAGVAAGRDLVARMGRELAAPAVAAVADNPGQARDRLDLADRNLAEARAALDRGEPARAAPAIRAAESAVDQAGRLLAAVRRRSAELAAAAAGLRAVLDDTERDLAAARSLVTAEQRWQAELAPHIARARSVMRQVRADLAAGPVDPIAEHQRLQEAHDALDEALSGVRGERVRRRSAAVQLDQAILVARSEIAAAACLIATRCGAVGSTARTRLAEAERRLGRAAGLAGPDPVAALTDAQQAAALGQQAGQLAERDVRGHSLAGVPGGDGDLAGAGGFGGPATRVRRGRPFPAADRVTTDHGGFRP
ncbi:hypothetical protein, partial [Actinomadura kijaniata]|uniref:hypothetical protein n=1 Tax=Actinomadura kijaniata TaxID=46161 RepID=UPI0031CFAAEE